MIFKDDRPIYLQITEYLKTRIIKGEYDLGEKLPAVREIAGNLKVNPNTVQRSYQILEQEEIIVSQRGIGSFVTEDEEKVKLLRKNIANDLINEFIKDMMKIGFTKSEIIEIIKNREEQNG
ncbi:MAG: GntR family transcriptional regulator [Tissierellia bacterium]|nr:GntR family transcriptional regulator [Tissierellia bacterium]